MHRTQHGLLVLLALLAATAAARGQAPPPAPLVPESFTLNEAAQRAIDAEWLTGEERAALRVFHGVWDDRDLITPALRAEVALNAWRLDDPVFDDPAVPVEVRAEARQRAGALREAIALVEDEPSPAARRIHAEALETLGDYAAAAAAAAPVVDLMKRDVLTEAGPLTEGVQALILRARLEGQPARDFQSMMKLLARAHQEIDRLYWPARLVEARLLIDKHNTEEAIRTLHEVLSLNPRCAEAWYELGRIALARFDFSSVNLAVEALRRVDRGHPLADLLYAESRLVQNDPEDALEMLDKVIARWPRLREAHALAAAAYALRYEDDALEQALARYEALSPGSAEAYLTAGRFLSMFRQYDEAAAMLEEAIRRQPAWPAPRLELGLMEMQTGRDAKAHQVLEDVVALDPFNKRAANSLLLLEQLMDFNEVETEHFVIRYSDGVDAVMVDMMPEALERIHAIVSGRFRWEPGRKTMIELMPDHQKFAVRITGMPHIHTIAACTGPVIAMEVPREGPRTKHHGVFDWIRVIQHEYTHTITLDQTEFRIPHWLTEAAAVSMEPAPRSFDTCLTLAESYRDGTLFDLDEIKWAFVRPQRPGDRGKAYAQGHWMVQFMNERFGPDALVALLGRYNAGDRESAAIPAALGVSREDFYADFLEWAGAQVRAWGLDPQPSLVQLTDTLRWQDEELTLVMMASKQARLDAIAEAIAERIGAPARPSQRSFSASDWPPLMRPPVEISDEQLAAWRREYPDHPDLLRLDIERRLDALGGPDESLVELLERYAELRPVDMFPHRILAKLYLDLDRPAEAVEHLEELDAREEKTAVYALQLARIHRELGQTAAALRRITRAAQMNPYDAPTREMAAAIAVEAQRLDLARMHIRALTILEPDRPQHQRRLERIETLLKG